MSRNIFEGESVRADLADKVYLRLLKRKWFSYDDVAIDYDEGLQNQIAKYGISKCSIYGELKKAFAEVLCAVKQKEGDNSIKVKKNKVSKRGNSYCYVGEEEDPLAEMRRAKVIKDIKRYYDFCQDSAGFFPISWLEYFLKDSMDLLAIRRRKHLGNQVVSTSSLGRSLTNVEFLPRFYDAIKRKQVLEIDYAGNKPPYDIPETLIFHPQYLREYNGRWQLYGHAEGKMPEFGYKIAVDRIAGEPRFCDKKLVYVAAPPHFYDNYFKNIVGVTHLENSTPMDVCIRVHSLYMYKLVSTKCFHPSQKTIMEFGTNGCQYADFLVHVEINNEFIGSILQMGSELEIVSPSSVRETFKKRIEDMADRYR